MAQVGDAAPTAKVLQPFPFHLPNLALAGDKLPEVRMPHRHIPDEEALALAIGADLPLFRRGVRGLMGRTVTCPCVSV